MRSVDVNVLVYSFREDSADHQRYYNWLQALIHSGESFALSDQVLSSFLRLVTHPSIFRTPTSMEAALTFVDVLRQQPNCVRLVPGPRHWNIFSELCRATGVRGNLVPDAYLAAMAIESGCEWITTDRDFSRFPGLRWRHPFK